jgi:hypothetical protein
MMILGSDISALIRDTFERVLDIDQGFRCNQVAGRQIYVGRDYEGNLIALFPAGRGDKKFHVNDVSFFVRQDVKWFGEISQSDTMSLLRYHKNSNSDIAVFSEAVASVVNATRSNSRPEEYEAVIDSWLSLLNSGMSPTYSEVLGLWGELFVISKSNNIHETVNSWQWNDSQSCDFVSRGEGIEVKTSSTSIREHTTSLIQHQAALNFPTFLFSILTAESSTGLSISQLSKICLERVADDQLASAKIVSACARRVGFGSEYQNTGFDKELADRYALVFEWNSVPDPNWPPAVTKAQWSFLLDDSDGEAILAFGRRSVGVSSLFTDLESNS